MPCGGSKLEKEKKQLATKEDIYRLEKIILEKHVEIEKRFTQTIITVVTTIIAITGIAVAIIKL